MTSSLNSLDLHMINGMACHASTEKPMALVRFEPRAESEMSTLKPLIITTDSACDPWGKWGGYLAPTYFTAGVLMINIYIGAKVHRKPCYLI